MASLIRSIRQETTKMTIIDATKPSGLPVPDPCLSFWQQTTRSFPHLNANKDAEVPASSEYAIIGSGISGALTAFELTRSGVEGSSISIFEAREAASGASSRNAGHVRPDAFRGFQVYRKIHGTEQALKIIANERSVFHHMNEFVKQHNVPCDFNPATTFDVCLTRDFADFNARSFQEFKDAGGDVSHIKIYEGDEARWITGIDQAVAAYEWPAGSSHPAKLAQWLLNQSISAGARLYTHCPVTEVIKSSLSSDVQVLWDLRTPRGSTAAQNVVHCTNAFAAHLLPWLASFVTPNRAQAHAIVPPPSLSGDKILPSTLSLRHSLKHFNSVMQRRADGIIILGTSRENPNISKEASESRLSTDDRVGFNAEVRREAMRSFESCFPVCEPGRLRHGEGLLHTWTGIIGMTTDSVPFVGKLESLPGQYICAGFNGHGEFARGCVLQK